MQKVLSFVMSVIMTVLGIVGTFISDGIKKSYNYAKDYFAEFEDRDVTKLDEGYGFVNDIVVVFFEKGVSLRKAKKIIEEHDGKIVGYVALLNRYQVKTDKKNFDQMLALCENLMSEEKVVFACPNLAFNYTECFVPDDPWDNDDNVMYWNENNPSGKNWHLESVQAESAWDYDEYFNHIDLGIVDSGFDVNHEDLEGKIVFPQRFLERQNRSNSHGTHVAGIMSANANNKIGVTGLCWDATLHCVDWEYEEDQFWIDGERILTGLAYTVLDGAKVVNFSLGLELAEGKRAFPRILMHLMGSLVSCYIALLLDRGYDFIVCQSAGNGDYYGDAVNAFNNGFFCCVTPENCFIGPFDVSKQDVLDRIIIVGNARLDGNKKFIQSPSSNAGSVVDICAPGTSILSTDIADKNYYSYKSGTSMASPIVAAICGMVWSIDSTFTGAEVRNIVCDVNNTCYDVPATTEQIYDDVNYQDYRMVNAKLSVENAIEISNSRH